MLCFMLCYVMLCYVLFCYVVMLCYVMLCYVMLCYVMQCNAMLYVRLPVLLIHFLHLSQCTAGITKKFWFYSMHNQDFILYISFHLCGQPSLLIQLYQA